VSGLALSTRLVGRVVEREARVERRVWNGSVFSIFVAPVLYLLAMGLGMGALVDRNTGTVDGLPYLAFVAPGLLAATAAQNAAGYSLWPVMGGLKWIRTFHGMVATPIRPGDVQRGLLVGTAAKTAAAATTFVVAAALLGAIESWWAPLAIPAAALTATAFGAPLTAYAAGRDSDTSFFVLMRLVILPLFLFSGVFYPVEDLPDLLEQLVWLSPLYHGVELCRAATTGTGDPLALAGSVAFLLAVIGAGCVAGDRAFTRKLTA
jgi:lipooligosaccharide transport system permease protein